MEAIKIFIIRTFISIIGYLNKMRDYYLDIYFYFIYGLFEFQFFVVTLCFRVYANIFFLPFDYFFGFIDPFTAFLAAVVRGFVKMCVYLGDGHGVFTIIYVSVCYIFFDYLMILSEETLRYLTNSQDGSSGMGNYPNFKKAVLITEENFHILDPRLTKEDIKMIIPGYDPEGVPNVLDLFRGLHFRSCIKDNDLLALFDQVFKMRFAGLNPILCDSLGNCSNGTIENLYRYKCFGFGFVDFEEILEVYHKYDDLENAMLNIGKAYRLSHHAYSNFCQPWEDYPFEFFGFE